jgi:hypothetical protein
MPTKAELLEELQNVRLQKEIAVHKLQLKEQLSYSPPYDLINPFAQIFDGQPPIFPLFPSRWDYRLFNSGIWVSEAQLDLIRMYSRFLYDTNLTAKGVVRALENYIIKTGFTYQASSKAAQKVLDDFLNHNNFFNRELDLFRRSRRDGEFFVALFPQENGITEIRTIEPEQVRPPNAEPEWLFGVKVDSQDKEKPLAYWVTYDGTVENGEEFKPENVVHCKINVDLIIRRGLSDFFSSQESLQGVQKLLRAGVQGESVRQAIAYVRQFAQAPMGTVQAMQAASTDYLTAIPTGFGSPRLQPVHQMVPGQVSDIPEGLEMKNGPTGAGANAVAILQAAYQQLSTFWQVPSWVISGDTGSTNYSASLTAESPFVRNCEKEQKIYSLKFREILLKVLAIAKEQGELDPNQEVDVVVHVPPVWVRNAKEESDRNQVLYNAGLLSKRTWSDREELNFEAEKENKEKDKDGPPIPAATGAAQSTTPAAEYKRETGDV